MLNENILKGKWLQAKAQILSTWAKLTDDEVERTKGDTGQLLGLIQQRYGEAQEGAREKLNSFVGNLFTDKNEPNLKV